jgi:hypothetical protein
MLKQSVLIILLLSFNLFSQNERSTKGAENGYAWLSMDNPALMYSTSKQNYLSSILDRLRITNEKHPEVASLGCKEDIAKLNKQGKSNEISITDVVDEMDKFYSQSENLVIPIVFAYCYTIKKFAGASIEELKVYKNEVLLFCYE